MTGTDPKTQACSGEITKVMDHLFRHEAGKMVSALTRKFGVEHLGLAEDVVQEALMRALQTWPYYGIPRNPAAWIMQVSKNLAIDHVRRQKVFRNKEAVIARFVESGAADSGKEDSSISEQEFRDDRLWMMFLCCHPIVPQDAQVSLALRTICGFGTGEIAKAFLTSEAAVAKKLTRARQRIRDADIPFELPSGEELYRRLDGVMQSIYLLFNEGYKASGGEDLIRKDLCFEAIRLGTLVTEHPSCGTPRAHALLALMLLSAARLPARLDEDGNILLLKEQDRSAWDQSLIARGFFHLMQSTEGDELSKYHLEAGIAACHSASKDYESTDWRRILTFYDQLVLIDDSPVVALNRAVAVAYVHGPEAGLKAVDSIGNREQLDSYYLLYAVLGEFEELLSNPRAAAGYFRKSLELVTIESERKFLTKRLRVLDGVSGRA